MDDNKPTDNENQPFSPHQPEGPGSENETINEDLQPEELPPDVASPVAEDIPPPQEPPMAEEIPPIYEESKKNYLFIILGLIFFVVIFVLVFKFLFTKKQKKQIKLTYWGLWEDKEVFDPLIKKYQKQNPNIKIDYIKMSARDNYREKLIARSRNGQGPDIFRFHNTWLPEIKEVVAPLPENIMRAEEFEKTFYPVHKKDLKIGDKYFGLPLEIDGLVLVCNQDLFEKARINLFPTNWEEVIEMASKLTVKDKNGRIITSGLAIGTASNIEHFSDLFGLMLLQNGASLKELTQPQAIALLEQYRKLAEPPESFWDENMPNSLSAFAQEKVAMIIVPSWEILVIKKINPDIKLKVIPVPQLPEGKPISLANYWVEGVSRVSKNQIEGWKFLKFLIEKDNLTTLYKQQANLRLFGEPYSRVDLASTLSDNQYIGAVIKQANYYTSLPLISRTYDNGLNDKIIQYLENAINATINGLSYESALQTAQEGINQVYKEYGIE